MISSDYEQFIATKHVADIPTGFDCPIAVGPLFDFQAFCVEWALKRGRAALFEDTGLGKSFQQVTWAHEVYRHTGENVIIAAPLCVAEQTVEEAEKLNITVRYCRSQAEVLPGITITNYEMLEGFDLNSFGGVVLDESSILKGDGTTTNFLINSFRHTPYKLVCSATPSPNELPELGLQAEFLSVMSKEEMLATFFTHDGGDTNKWRLKGHGKAKFWEWMATWAICIRNPSDLGFDGSRYILPALHIHERVVSGGEIIDDGVQYELIHKTATDLFERRAAKRNSISQRVELAAKIANESGDAAIVWCHWNDESERLAKAIPDAVEVTGSMKLEKKREAILDFTHGQRRVIVSKPSMCGAGMNWQHANQMIFAGMNDSFEDFYQAVRRMYRFGQKREVHVHVIVAETEGAVRANILAKQAQADEMAEQMRPYMLALHDKHITGATRGTEAYRPTLPVVLPAWVHQNVEMHR